MKRMVTALAVAWGITAGHAQSDPTVTVAGGKIRGALVEGGGAMFKGIPYAQPPVGTLRWREPQPVKAWAGVRSATESGKMCAQKASPRMPNAAEITSEDCLFLNVWTPEWPVRSPKAVMVSIPGGGNRSGGSAQPFADSGSLSQRGIVLVSFNYRLGPFGFFSHPLLTRESHGRSAANQGLLDQIAALEWVRDNIERFGGDPGKVTIFGSSAGGLDVSVLMTSDLAKGLFHRAISQSGPWVIVEALPSLSGAEKRGQAQAARWKVGADSSLAALRAISTKEILDAQPDLVGNPALFPSLGLTVDGYLFTRSPSEVFAKGRQHRVPLLIGNNARENIPGTGPTDLAKGMADGYGPLAARAQPLYVSTDPVYGSPMAQWETDTTFRCPAVAQSVWHARAGNPVFEYEFARVAAGREALGSTHAAETSHVYGTLDRGVFGVGPPAKATDVDWRVSEVMQRYWTNFAKTGDPNGAGLPKWPRFDPSSRAHVQFTDAGPIAKDNLRRAHCDLFIENVERLMSK